MIIHPDGWCTVAVQPSGRMFVGLDVTGKNPQRVRAQQVEHWQEDEGRGPRQRVGFAGTRPVHGCELTRVGSFVIKQANGFPRLINLRSLDHRANGPAQHSLGQSPRGPMEKILPSANGAGQILRMPQSFASIAAYLPMCLYDGLGISKMVLSPVCLDVNFRVMIGAVSGGNRSRYTTSRPSVVGIWAEEVVVP
jgi:hypothetical protein